MKFDLDEVLIEEGCQASVLAARVMARLRPGVEIRYVADGREVSRPLAGVRDSFAAGKRRMVIMRRRAAFVMGCPAASPQFACCGYLVAVLASNCPMDCSYCFLQEYLADNPAFQIYANYDDLFHELDQLGRRGGSFRVGTGELADSLAFDSLTGIGRELVEYFAARENLMLELKTKTDEIENLLAADPKGRTLVSWSLSPPRVHETSEHRTATPARRLAAAKRVLDAGYKVGFHLDPIIAYPEAERDYLELLDNLFDLIAPERIALVSMGGLRMTPKLRDAARRRFPHDPMLVGEEVLTADGRYRAFAPIRLRLFSRLRERIVKAGANIPLYLCMESASVYARILGVVPGTPAAIGAHLAKG